MLSMYDGDQLPELFSEDGYAYLGDGSADLATGMTSLAFIRAVLQRTKKVWRTLTVLGLLIGIGVAVKLPVAYEATTSLLLTPQAAPGEASGAPILNEQALAQSRPVAQLAVKKLGLQESVTKFMTSYTVTVLTDRVLVITTKANSSAQAVRNASAIATEFLSFRKNLAITSQNLVLNNLQQAVTAANKQVQSIQAQINALPSRPTTAQEQATLNNLNKELGTAKQAAATQQEYVAETKYTANQATDQVVDDSSVLNPASALPPHSKVKRLLEYAGIGLVGGLLVGMGGVIVGALMSNRLRRRDDIARALMAPIEVSVGKVARGRLRPGSAGLQGAGNTDLDRIVAYLDSVLWSSDAEQVSLAVVPVDDVRVPALCVVSLAISCAQRGARVVVSDLCDGAPAARLLGVTQPGVRRVTVEGVQLTAVVPEHMLGPLDDRASRPEAAQEVVDACAAADVLLTLTVLDPSLGGQHLSGWAQAAVATVTAGQSTATRIHAVGEMVRLAGIPLICGVVIGADKTDESLGVLLASDGEGDLVREPDSRPGGNVHVVSARGSVSERLTAE
jgi:capsular polysaccharide biosynthesis protein